MSPSRSLARVLGLVILGLLVSSPLSAQSDSSPVLKPLVEDRASRAWKRMRSAHFTAVGDASERDMQRTLTELEVFRATLLAAFPSMTLDAGGPLTVILFSSRDAIAPFVPRDANGWPEREIIGYQTSNGEATYLVMVVGQNLPSLRDPVSLVVSSLMEDVVARNIPHAPYWVRVGLAELYSVPARSNEERRVLGRANRSSVSWLRNAALLPFDVMTRIGGEDDLDETNPSTFFAQSWALVHYLILSGQRTGQLDAYLEALRRGLPSSEAFTASFPSADAMAVELRSYVGRTSFPAVSIDLPSSLLDARPRAEPLLESEALAVQAELLLNRGYTVEAEKHLIHLREINIRASAPRLLLGRQLVIAGRADDAVLTLTDVVADDPLNPAAHHHLAKAYLAARKPDLALDQYQSATALSPKWSSPWYGASIAAMALGRDADAAAATVALRTLVSGNGWLSSRAWDLWSYRGREDYLIADAREVIGTGWRQSAADYLGLLASLAYERQGQTADAQTLLAELMVGVEPGWVTTIAMFLKGELSAEELISKASTDGERTEAHAYVGVKASLAGDVSTAREHLTWVKDQGLKRFMEYGMAVAELEWLDRQKP